MFSLESFYKILDRNLFEPLNLTGLCFNKFGSKDPADLAAVYIVRRLTSSTIFYDQEPIYLKDILDLHFKEPFIPNHFAFSSSGSGLSFVEPFLIFANSEISKEKNLILKDFNYNDWYYFFHGFAALDWYRNIRYLPPIRKYSKVFISFNNIYTENRSYRLNLISKIIDKELDHLGYISMNPDDVKNKIKQEIFSSTSKLSIESKKLIFQHFLPNPPTFLIDFDTTHGTFSANDDLETMSLGLFHIVTETIFYDEKLHLTEKIFKPIVSRRPFFLVGAPGNLAYLKSYGFKTFDRWIDESYDLETDPDQRIIKIVNELERICKLPSAQLDKMYEEMQEVLGYNFNWFYGQFKQVIVDELVDNFRRCIIQHNAGKDSSFDSYIKYLHLDFDDVKKRLAQ